MGTNSRTARVWGLAACLPLGCYSGLDGAAGAAGEDAAESGGSDRGPDDDSDGGDDGPTGDACEGGSHATIALRYLTREEYENTVRDLFGETLDVTTAFAPDESVGGYFANSTQAPSATQLEMYVDTAHRLAQVAIEERFDRFASCLPSDAGCARTFIADFGRRVFRRPLEADEIAAYESDYEAIAADQGAELGLQVVAAAMLASPHFLYIGERSEIDDPTTRAYDLASRLSYFLWATMPDEPLLQAAESGELSTTEGVEAQVRRMLEDDRAADMLASFSTQWLDVGALPQAAKHPEQFPQWTPDLVAAAQREIGELVRHVVQGGDARLESLLLSRDAYVDASLAALYGVDAPDADAGWVTLPADERAGLLTRAAFLARHSHATENSWVHRGKVVRERLLCGVLPPPPPVADDSPINDDSRLQDAACSGCHLLMDPIGVGFEAYDPIGAFVGGAAPGRIEGLDDPAFDGAIDLSERLATSREAQACFAVQMFGYAHRRASEGEDACAIEAATAVFVESDGDIVELVTTLATTNAFTGFGGG